jgi:hypothetical protein
MLDPGVEAGEAGATRLTFLELNLQVIVCHMLRIRLLVLHGRHRRGRAFSAGDPKLAFRVGDRGNWRLLRLSPRGPAEGAVGADVSCRDSCQCRSTLPLQGLGLVGSWSMRKLWMCSARPRNQCFRDTLEHDRRDVAPLSAAAVLSIAASAASDTLW